jgi:hypothetical protein
MFTIQNKDATAKSSTSKKIPYGVIINERDLKLGTRTEMKPLEKPIESISKKRPVM